MWSFIRAFCVILYFSIVFCTQQNVTVNVSQVEFSKAMTFSLSDRVEQILLFPISASPNPYTLKTWSSYASSKSPVQVIVHQEREILAWTIPLSVQTSDSQKWLEFTNTSRTLCYNQMADLVKTDSMIVSANHQKFVVSLSSFSPTDVSVSLVLEEELDFYLQTNDTKRTFSVSPSSPKYFLYKFPQNDVDTVVVEISADNEVCLTVSVQDNHCPVFDLNQDITYKGIYRTMSKTGGLKIRRHNYPNGFFLVFVAKPDNYYCIQKRMLIPSQRSFDTKTSIVQFSITEGIYGPCYAIAISVVLVVMFVLAIAMVGFLVYQKRRRQRSSEYHRIQNAEEQNTPRSDQISQNQEDLLNREIDVSRRDQESENPERNISDKVERSENHQDLEDEENNSIRDHRSEGQEANISGRDHIISQNQQNPEQGQSNIFERVQTSEIQQGPEQAEQGDNIFDGDSQQLLERSELTVDCLSKRLRENRKTSWNYLWHVSNMALFYGIPVVQLVVTYERVMYKTGDEDLCYYNFLCANPLWGLYDFNHVFSNVGYIFVGILFLGVVFYRQNFTIPKETGIPVYYGVFYAMGSAVIIEGILSGCYHVCPNQSNYQFDVSFMYVIAVLCIVKLYQNRHSDINASSYATFTVLGSTIFLAMVGILDDGQHAWVLWTFIILIYLSISIYLSFEIYFLNFVLDGLSQVRANRRFSSPLRRSRFIILFTANGINFIILIVGCILCMNGSFDFGTFLLIVLMGNALLYTIIYTSMKFINKERLTIEAWVYGILAIALWIPAFCLFLYHNTMWSLSPAESRHWNHECVLLNFYDQHDIWHLLSAGALYFTFMFLLYLDDDVADTDRKLLKVF